METNITRWWWIRHAPVTIAEGKLYGQRDLPANVSESHLFKALSLALPLEAAWIITPLKRTRQTADAINEEATISPNYHIEQDFIEQNFGEWQGLSWDELHKQAGDNFHKFWVAPANQSPPGGESFVNVINRVGPAIDRLTSEHQGKDIISVAHGGSIRAAIAHALGLCPEKALAIMVDNCSLSCLEHVDGPGKGSSWRISCINFMINRFPQ